MSSVSTISNVRYQWLGENVPLLLSIPCEQLYHPAIRNSEKYCQIPLQLLHHYFFVFPLSFPGYYQFFNFLNLLRFDVNR